MLKRNEKKDLRCVYCNTVDENEFSEVLSEYIQKDELKNIAKFGLIKKKIKKLFNRWFITAFTGMAQGLFATLLAGTILSELGRHIDNDFGKVLVLLGNLAKFLMGAGIGIGIAYYLKMPKIVIFTSAFVGMAGALAEPLMKAISNGEIDILLKYGLPGNPVSSYITVMLAIEISKYLEKKTSLDILVVPISMMLLSFVGLYVSIPFIELINLIAKGIELSINKAPFVMGVIISVVMGILLTMPTSSAAVWISIAHGKTSEAMLIAGGAAVVGCAAHMVGFAVMSYRENKVGGLISQGIGTSMLQIPNIMRKPILIVPPIIASAIVGPLSTCVFKLRCNAVGGGMGTSGLVGVFGVLDVSTEIIEPWKLALGLILLMLIIPTFVCLLLSEIMRRKNIIKQNDLKI